MDKHPTPEIPARISTLLKYLNKGLYEKEKALRLALLSLVAGESIFFLGVPGVAKSMIARKLANLFTGAGATEVHYFDYLLNEFSTPDELFGPVSLKALEADEYKRITDGFLPEADIAFLDEIWKAGPAILNTLLTLINERKFHNGREVIHVPLKGLLAASNEYPAAGRGLEALWDRFIVRVYVESIRDSERFCQMIAGATEADDKPSKALQPHLISMQELQTWRKSIDLVELPQEVQQFILSVRKELELYNQAEEREDAERFFISDRRWKKIVHLLRTSAFLNGRAAVDLLDASLIGDCIWSMDAQREAVGEILYRLLSQVAVTVTSTIEQLEKSVQRFEEKINTTWCDNVTKPEVYQQRVTEEENGKKTSRVLSCYRLQLEGGKTGYVTCEPAKKQERRKKKNYEYITVVDSIYYCYAKGNGYSHVTDVSFSLDSEAPFVTIEGEKYLLKLESEWNIKEALCQEEVHKSLKTDFDKNYYQPLRDAIQEELQRLEAYKEHQLSAILQNLFVEENYRKALLTNMDKTLQAVEDVRVLLEKQRDRYATLQTKYPSLSSSKEIG